MSTGVTPEQDENGKQAPSSLNRRDVLLAGASVAVTVLLNGGKSTMAGTLATPIYAIEPNDDMLFYRHDGAADGSPNWPIQAAKIGNGWNFRQVFAGDSGAVYAITQTGDLLFYKHGGFNDGSPDWPVQAAKIGNGWDFRQVFAGPQGAIYTVSENGDLHYYRHLGFNDGSNSWQVQAVKIGNGWNFRQVFAGPQGAI